MTAVDKKSRTVPGAPSWRPMDSPPGYEVSAGTRGPSIYGSYRTGGPPFRPVLAKGGDQGSASCALESRKIECYCHAFTIEALSADTAASLPHFHLLSPTRVSKIRLRS